MKIVFMGTPDFSANILESIIKAGYEVVLVVTQPDRPKGRGGKVSLSPVKECAVKYGLEVFQPDRIKNEEEVKKLSSVNADIFVVAAFGQILSKQILEMPKYGCVNVHASLLPEYRGAAPIQQAILDGREKTGVTIMQMDEGIDTGDIIMKEEVMIDKKETGGSLFEKLSEAGSGLIIKALKAIEDKTAQHLKQDAALASHVKQIKKEMGRIDFNRSASEIERMIRAFNPWPGAFTSLDGRILKIWDADVSDEDKNGAAAGETILSSKDAFYVKCGEGSLKINEVQPEGKKRMQVKDFLLGYRIKAGDMLG